MGKQYLGLNSAPANAGTVEGSMNSYQRFLVLLYRRAFRYKK
jgi:hypothetical protein